MYAHVAAHNDALRRFGPTVDWMVFMDMDEFLVSDQPIPEMARTARGRRLRRRHNVRQGDDLQVRPPGQVRHRDQP